MFDKVDNKLNLPKVDEEILKVWEEQNIFERSIKNREKEKAFVFYEGPPGTNGLPHMGHASTRIFKDTILRYFAMKGYKVLRKAGWDTHGLPVELQAEKELGLVNKAEIEKYGEAEFINYCKKIIKKYENDWKRSTEKLGFWVNLNEAYHTCDDNYIESVFWSLKKLFEQGDIYQGYRVSPYCPRCGTSLANHEVAQGYKLVTDRTIYVKFKREKEENTYFIAWTTTPWTLPSNVALAVNPEVTYAKIQPKEDENSYIVALNLADKLFEDYVIKAEFKGKDLEGEKYLPVFDVPKTLLEDKNCYIVTLADYVTTENGTGIVHIAPAFGVDDSNVGKNYDLPFLKLIDEQGCFTKDVKYSGKRNIEANKEIISDLKQEGKILKEEQVEHEYPHCWRCKTPLIYYAREGWFIKMSKYREELVKNNNTVDWHPESIKVGRMGNFLSNAMDWNLSRDRYWGTPLNIWKCNACGKLHAVGSKAELSELSGVPKEKIELHKPKIDEIKWKCECGGEYNRVPQVIDCWYDAGSMPFAQFHYPFENKELFEEQFPADFILEAQDQTRGWFYTLQAIGTTVFKTSPYKACVVCGHITDKFGQKMSKSLGNIVSTDEQIERFGADAVRFYFCSNSAPWLSQRYDPDSVAEVYRKTISTLWNTYAFFVLYANLDDFNPQIKVEECKLNLMDRWILSQLNEMIQKIDTYMQDFNFTDSSRLITEFTDDLSNWYVRRSRERFWTEGVNEDKTAAFTTLHFVLLELSKLIAPFMPFIADKMYLNLSKNSTDKKDSVHLEDFPKVNAQLIDKKLNEQMREVIDIVALGRAARNANNLKNRQPLQNVYIYTNMGKLKEEYLNIIADDLNVKCAKFIENPKEYLTFELKPQLKTLGKKYGKEVNTIREFLSSTDAFDLVSELQSGNTVKLPNSEIELTEQDVLIYPKSKADFCSETYGGITVILDTTLTQDLLDEGDMREFVSKVQFLRKEAGYEVEDRILLSVKTEQKLKDVLIKFEEEICKTVLCEKILFDEIKADISIEADINGKQSKIMISKVKQ